MRVPVNDPTHAGCAIGGFDSDGIHILNLRGRASGVCFASCTRLVGELVPNMQREREEASLPIGGAHAASKLLVRMVVSAQRVAVCDEHALTIQLDHHRVLKEPYARFVAELAAEQEIPIAVDDERR